MAASQLAGATLPSKWSGICGEKLLCFVWTFEPNLQMCTFLINHLQLDASHKRTKDFLSLSKVVSKITSLDCGI